MHAVKTKTQFDENPAQTARGVATMPVSVPAIPTKPSLESVVQAICLDAKNESVKYLLRSDTGHDGE